MEDLWAAGPSWGSEKPSASLPKMEMEEPETSFDVSDPWGAGSSSAVPDVSPIPNIPQLDPPDVSYHTTAGEATTFEAVMPSWSPKEDIAWEGGSGNPLPDMSIDNEETATPRAISSPSPPVLERLETPRPPSWASPTQAVPPIQTRRISTTSEGGWGGDERPFTPPSPSSPINSPARDESWGGEDLEDALQAESRPPPISFTPPKFDSPTFGPVQFDSGDGFGGFSSTVNTFSNDMEDDDDDDEGTGWGRVRSPVIMQDERRGRDQEEDWEDAQRRLRAAEERVPREKVEKMKDAWKELILGLVADRLEALNEEAARQLDQNVKKLEEDTYESLRSLSMIPPDINTYPPVISSLVTHERHAYALTRPNTTPSTSLLVTSTSRKPRRDQSLNTESPWLSRSKLGEPDAPASEAAPATEASTSRWSFWRKPTLEKPLVTSGGGILEVKTPVTPGLSRASSETHMASKPGSIMSKQSRPSSPALVTATGPSFDDARQSPTNTLVDATSTPMSVPSTSTPPTFTPQPAPSAVSRFWGRLGRSKTPAQQAASAAGDSKDLEISADEFNFLSEIPSLNEHDHHAVGDLLSVEPGRSEDIASLESMLASKPAALPPPLAPPPRRSPVPRVPSTGGGRFVARMKESGPSDMDLLGGLDFDSPSSTPPPGNSKNSPLASTSSSMWDDFLSPSASSPAQNLPTLPSITSPPVAGSSRQISPPPIAPPPAFSHFAMPDSSSSPINPLSPPPTSQTPTSTRFPSVSLQSPIPQPIRPSQPPQTFGSLPPVPVHSQPQPTFGSPGTSQPAVFPKTQTNQTLPNLSNLAPPQTDDFDDFGTPQKASQATFDDFDFSSFETPNVKRNVAPPTIQAHAPRVSLNHTPTMNLMSNVNASRGQRWPAPPSPIGPILEPPPKAASGSTPGFPFLSPPPPPTRMGSARGVAVDLLGGDGGNAAPMASKPPTALGSVQPKSNMGQSGKTSDGPTDWSFFDNL